MYRRRTLLRAGVTAGALAMAGCTEEDGSTDPADEEADDTEDDEDEDAGTDSATATENGTETDDGTDTDDGDGGGQTAQRVRAVSTVGLVADGAISAVEIVVASAAGSGDVDLTEVTIQWVDAAGVYNLLASSADSTASADGTFRITPIEDRDGSAPVVNAPEDRLQLSMDLGAAEEVSGVEGFGEPLEPGESATLRLTTQSGAVTAIRLAVPDTLAGQEAVAL